jgi:hypothetical protein
VYKVNGEKYKAQITIDGTHHYLGQFKTKKEAGIAYDRFVVGKSNEEVIYTLNYSNMTDQERKKAVPTQKKKLKKMKVMNVVDAAGKAALTSAELVNAPVNPDCPDDLKAKYGEFFSRSGQYMPAVFFSHFKCLFLVLFWVGKIYNNFGRIGIYTPQQRLVIMNRHRLKRTNLAWKKDVQYECRKKNTDKRLRIKVQFVDKDREEAKAYVANLNMDLVCTVLDV